MHILITCSYIFQTNERLKKEPRQSKQRGTESFGTTPFKQRRTSKVWQCNFIIFTIVPLHHCLSVLGLILCPFFCLSSVWFSVHSSVCLFVCHVCLISVGVHLSGTNRCCCLFIYLFIYFCVINLPSRRKREENKKHIEQSVKERQKVCWYCIVLFIDLLGKGLHKCKSVYPPASPVTKARGVPYSCINQQTS